MPNVVSSPPSPPLRYCAMAPNELSGYLREAGSRRPRYFVLRDSDLSCYRSEGGERPLWDASVRGARVELSVRGEINICLAGKGGVLRLVAEESERDVWLFGIVKGAKRSSKVEDYYRIGELIGEGMNGQVRSAIDAVTGEKVAVKMVERVGGGDDFLAREIQVVLSLEHEHVVKVIDIFLRKSKAYFVMEYLAGGELFDYVSDNRVFDEAKARVVITDLLHALVYLHDRGIVHRDVKLENLLTTREEWPYCVKLADFGFSNFVPERKRAISPPGGRVPRNDAALTSFVGTPYYIAPEMLAADGHGRPVDVWATGVTLYILLSGKFPFGGETEKEYYARVVKKNCYFPDHDWAGISEECKNLLCGLLDKDPARRLTAKQALAHDWFCGVEDVKEELRMKSRGIARDVGAGVMSVGGEEVTRKSPAPVKTSVVWKEAPGVGVFQQDDADDDLGRRVMMGAIFMDDAGGLVDKAGYHGGSLGALGAVMSEKSGEREQLDRMGGRLAPTRSSPTVVGSLASRALLSPRASRSQSKKKAGWIRPRNLRSRKSQVSHQGRIEEQEMEERRKIERAREGQALRQRDWEEDEVALLLDPTRASGTMGNPSPGASGNEVEITETFNDDFVALALAPELLSAGLEESDDCEIFRNHAMECPSSTVLSDLEALPASPSMPGTISVMRRGVPPGMYEKDAVCKAYEIDKVLGPATKIVPGVPVAPSVLVRDAKSSTIVPLSRKDNTGPSSAHLQDPSVWNSLLRGDEEPLAVPLIDRVRIERGRINSVIAGRSLSESITRQDSTSRSSGKLRFMAFSRRSSLAHGVTSAEEGRYGNIPVGEERKARESFSPAPKKASLRRQFRNARKSGPRARASHPILGTNAVASGDSNPSNSRDDVEGKAGPPPYVPMSGEDKKIARYARGRRHRLSSQPEADEGGNVPGAGARVVKGFPGRKLGSGRISVDDAAAAEPVFSFDHSAGPSSPDKSGLRGNKFTAPMVDVAKNCSSSSRKVDSGKVSRLRFRSFHRTVGKDSVAVSGHTLGSPHFSRRSSARKVAPIAPVAPVAPTPTSPSVLDKLRRARSWRNEQAAGRGEDRLLNPWSEATQEALQHMGSETSISEAQRDLSFSFEVDAEPRPPRRWEPPVIPPTVVLANSGYRKI